MASWRSKLPLIFSCLGHAYMHLFTAFYFVIVLALEVDWQLPYHELIELWTLGALLVGLGALPAGWLGDRWSATGMMIVYFIGLGLAGILCGFLDSTGALLLGLAAIGLFSSIYHPVGIAWLVRHAKKRGKALGINGIFGSLGVAAAGLVAGALIDTFSWRAAFIVPGVVSLATGVLLLAAQQAGWVSDGEAGPKAELPTSRGDRLKVFAILVFTMLAIGLIFNATQAAMPKVFDLRLKDLAGEGIFGVGAIVASVYLIGGAVQLAGGYLADRFPLKPIYFLALAIQIPVLAAFAVFSGLPLILVAILTVLLSTAALPAENMLLARFTPQRHHSLAFGVKFVLAFGVGPVALFLVSAVEARSGEFLWLFAILATTAALATLAALLLPNERQARQAMVAAE